jgi:hypothetical protein
MRSHLALRQEQQLQLVKSITPLAYQPLIAAGLSTRADINAANVASFIRNLHLTGVHSLRIIEIPWHIQKQPSFSAKYVYQSHLWLHYLFERYFDARYFES